jgi:hypothetical protein
MELVNFSFIMSETPIQRARRLLTLYEEEANKLRFFVEMHEKLAGTPPSVPATTFPMVSPLVVGNPYFPGGMAPQDTNTREEVGGIGSFAGRDKRSG